MFLSPSCDSVDHHSIDGCESPSFIVQNPSVLIQNSSFLYKIHQFKHKIHHFNYQRATPLDCHPWYFHKNRHFNTQSTICNTKIHQFSIEIATLPSLSASTIAKSKWKPRSAGGVTFSSTACRRKTLCSCGCDHFWYEIHRFQYEIHIVFSTRDKSIDGGIPNEIPGLSLLKSRVCLNNSGRRLDQKEDECLQKKCRDNEMRRTAPEKRCFSVQKMANSFAIGVLKRTSSLSSTVFTTAPACKMYHF